MSKKALKIKVKKLDKRKLHKKLLISLGVKPRKGIIIICKNCGKENYRRQSHSQRVFCSKKCYGEFQKSGIYHKCKTCGKIYYRNKGQVKHRGETKYCSKQYNMILEFLNI